MLRIYIQHWALVTILKTRGAHLSYTEYVWHDSTGAQKSSIRWRIGLVRTFAFVFANTKFSTGSSQTLHHSNPLQHYGNPCGFWIAPQNAKLQGILGHMATNEAYG